jgi:membrane protease YdiL (CAAX protease family)
VRALVITILELLGFLMAVFAVMAVLAIPTRALLGDSESVESRLFIAVIGLQLTAGVAIPGWLIYRFRKSRLALAGWPRFEISLRWFLLGTLFGATTTGCSLLFTWSLGGGHPVLVSSEIGAYLSYSIPLAGALLLAALGEEWLFRGYPLTKLATSYGHGWAVVVTGLLFTAGHWGGEGWGPAAIVNLMLFSVILGLLRCGRGGIAAAWGFHFGWNTLFALSGATLTAEKFDIPMVSFTSGGHRWASGGPFGPEAGMGTTLATAGFLILMVYRHRHKGRADVAAEAGG